MTGMSFTPSDLAAAISKRRSDFRIVYEPDFRQVRAQGHVSLARLGNAWFSRQKNPF